MKLKMRENENAGRVIINGREFKGGLITIENGIVHVDGQPQGTEMKTVIDVRVYGDVQTLENHYGTVTAQNVGEIFSSCGPVNCGNVSGSVRTGTGNIYATKIAGRKVTAIGKLHS